MRDGVGRPPRRQSAVVAERGRVQPEVTHQLVVQNPSRAADLR
jgi:hypothetical protein